jgi:chromosome segregation ATPase
MDSKNIRDKLESIQSQLVPILKQYKEYYVLHNIEPNNEEYEIYYQNVSNNIEQLKNKLFDMNKMIDENKTKLSNDLSTINKKISDAREENNGLKYGLTYTEDEYNTSEEMIENYVDIYNLMYMKNFSLVMGIIGLGIFMSKHFSKQL